MSINDWTDITIGDIVFAYDYRLNWPLLICDINTTKGEHSQYSPNLDIVTFNLVTFERCILNPSEMCRCKWVLWSEEWVQVELLRRGKLIPIER